MKRIVWKLAREYKKKKIQKSKQSEKLKRLKKVGTAQRVSSSSSSSSKMDATKKGENIVADEMKEGMDMGEVNKVITEVVKEVNKESEVVMEKEVPAAEVELTQEEIEAAVELLKVKEAEARKVEIQRRKIAQANRPKEKGVVVKDTQTVKQRVDATTWEIGLIRLKKVVIDEEAKKDKCKGKVIEEGKEKEINPHRAQIDLDAEMALKLAEGERMSKMDRAEKEKENEELTKKFLEEEHRAIEQDIAERLEKKKNKSKSIIPNNQKVVDDEKMFVDFLKSIGYSGKQLSPMKLPNLLNLYEIERKKHKVTEEKIRMEM